MEREISIMNGDERVGLNSFSKAIVTSTILGMLRSLHGVDVEQEIRITISAAKKAGTGGRQA
ncbi:MAG TPA: hypothetical protein VMU36_00130 [Spirochaetia bacterium]|nr:hypothetical protein [Spirochaetia bacterium]